MVAGTLPAEFPAIVTPATATPAQKSPRRRAAGRAWGACQAVPGVQRTVSGSSILTSSTSRLSWRSRCTLRSSGLILTYLEITANSSRCSAGR
eukprot:gene36409-44909_t